MTYLTARSEYEWLTTKNSDRSGYFSGSLISLIRMISDSTKLMVEKAQQVPLLFWFFTEVTGSSLMVVNLYSGKLTFGF